METRTIFFLGKPGSGKGTQAKLLATKTGWPMFSSGALYRQIALEDTPAGRKTAEVIDNGYLMPPWFSMYLFQKSLFSLPAEASAIFDGFNRKIYEAELVIDSMKWLGREFAVINIEISDAEVQKRLALRKDIEGRADDNTVDTRLQEYTVHTIPALMLFQQSGTLITINGEQSREAIAEDIAQALTLS
jgi:adenylate kinase